MDLLKGIKVEEHTCRVCGRPSGLFDECDRCFLDRLESQFDALMHESGQPQQVLPVFENVDWEDELPERPPSTPPPETEPEPEPPVAVEPEPEPEPEPDTDLEAAPAGASVAPPVTAPPVAVVETPAPAAKAEPTDDEPTHSRRPLLLLLLLGVVAIAAVYFLVINGSGSDDTGTAVSAPQPPDATPTPPPPPVVGSWTGRIKIRYETGAKDQLTQRFTINSLNEGEVAGVSRSRQDGGICRGTLTYTGPQGPALTFDYTERNTDDCIGHGQVTLVARGHDTLDYREATKISVNRGTVTRD